MTAKKKVVYVIYSPAGWPVRVYNNRKEAHAFLEGINWHIPEWHYDELYKMCGRVVDISYVCHS